MRMYVAIAMGGLLHDAFFASVLISAKKNESVTFIHSSHTAMCKKGQRKKELEIISFLGTKIKSLTSARKAASD